MHLVNHREMEQRHKDENPSGCHSLPSGHAFTIGHLLSHLNLTSCSSSQSSQVVEAILCTASTQIWSCPLLFEILPLYSRKNSVPSPSALQPKLLTASRSPLEFDPNTHCQPQPRLLETASLGRGPGKTFLLNACCSVIVLSVSLGSLSTAIVMVTTPVSWCPVGLSFPLDYQLHEASVSGSFLSPSLAPNKSLALAST